MKRAPGEEFEEYKKRRKDENILTKLRSLSRWKWFHQGGTYRRKAVVPGPKRTVISAAVGKRHKGESVEHFRERRRVCNAKRRERETNRLTNKPLLGSMSLR